MEGSADMMIAEINSEEDKWLVKGVPVMHMMKWNAYDLCFQRQSGVNFVNKKEHTSLDKLEIQIVQ